MMNHTTNMTEPEFKFVASIHLHYVILSILIVAVNCIVIFLYFFRRPLRKPPNTLLLSLSCSDLLTGLVGLPLLLTCSTTPSCIACILSYRFLTFTSISTVLHILAITYERFAKIVFPFKIKYAPSVNVEVKVIAFLWGITLLTAAVPLVWSNMSAKSCFELEPESVVQKYKYYTIVLLIVFVALPLVFIIIADISVFVVVRRQLDRIQGTTLVHEQKSRERIKKETKVIAVMALMLLFFLICWSLYYTALFVHNFIEEEDLVRLPLWLEQANEILRCSTALMNPIFYVLLKHDFRKVLAIEIRRILSKCRKDQSLPNIRVRYTTSDMNHHCRPNNERVNLTAGSVLPCSRNSDCLNEPKAMITTSAAGQ